jgi:hypothetical protein
LNDRIQYPFAFRFHPDLEKRFAVSFDSSNLLNFLHENLQDKEELMADIRVCQKLLAEAHQNLGDMVRQLIPNLYQNVF